MCFSVVNAKCSVFMELILFFGITKPNVMSSNDLFSLKPERVSI